LTIRSVVIGLESYRFGAPALLLPLFTLVRDGKFSNFAPVYGSGIIFCGRKG
jgi:hypothetical protein